MRVETAIGEADARASCVNHTIARESNASGKPSSPSAALIRRNRRALLVLHDVLFARPDDLDRPPDLARDLGGLPRHGGAPPPLPPNAPPMNVVWT